jgi:DNA-binding NarL/FixJ family response regulator
VTPRVLVIDDDARVRTALCALLVSSTDLVPTEAATAADARAAADRDGSFDVAVIDVRLPDAATGLALIRQVARSTPVVAISVSSSHRPDALAAGAAAFLDKDGRPDLLLAAVNAAATPTRRSTR